MSARVFVVGGTTVVMALFWLLALWSYSAGNPSAVNALVGIPAGLVICLPAFWIALSDWPR